MNTRQVLLLSVLCLLCGCGGGGASTAPTGTSGQLTSASAALVPNTAVTAPVASPPSTRSVTLHEAQFAADPSLRADLGANVVVDHLETSTSTGAHDTASAGLDRIPFHVASSGPVHISLDAPDVATARIVDMKGGPVATLASGAQDVPLSSGDYQLELASTNQKDALVFISGVTTAARSAVPGVTITELPPVQMVSGASTSVTAFIGYGPSGPTTPTLITNMNDFTSAFGSTPTPLMLAVSQFFANGGNIATVVRVPLAAGTVPGAADVGTALQTLDSMSYNLLVLADVSIMPAAQADSALLAALTQVTAHRAMLLIDLPGSVKTVAAAVDWANAHPQLATTYAASYWPSLVINSPDGTQQTVGPAASMAGIYALTDSQAGVWKAPAGLSAPLANVLGLGYLPNDSDDGLLVPAGINPIRQLLGSFVPWGARTMTRQTQVLYVSERRVLEYIENSITQGLQWVVFEPETPSLFAAVTLEVNSFLNQLWASGGLVGSSASDAYLVECDIANNPPQTLGLGNLVVSIKVAISQPAEYEVITLTTAAGTSTAAR